MKASDLESILGSKKRKSVSDLTRFIRNRNDSKSSNFCLLLGSGASKSSGVKTGSELIEIWRDDVLTDTYKIDTTALTTEQKISHLKKLAGDWYSPAKEYSCLFEHKYPMIRQRRILIEKQSEGALPSIGYAYLVRITEAHYIRTIFTTNFDDLLNEAFYQFSTERPIVCAHDSSVSNISITSPRSKIIKLHGDYLFENIKTSVRETENLEKNTQEKLNEFLKEYGLIISGYSGSDDSIIQCLNAALSDNNYLRHGLYWCLRPDDEINDDQLKLLRKESSFYVLANSFDCLMAELHSGLCGEMLPFNSKIASDRATKVIDSYINNDQLKKSGSKVILSHLNELEKEKRSSSLITAINALHSERNNKDKVTDAELLVYISIERLIQARSYEIAIIKLRTELNEGHNNKFKKILLDRLYHCCRMMYKHHEASLAADQMLQLEPNNVYILLSKCGVLLDHDTKIQLLREAHKRAPYVISIMNQLCAETKLRFEAPLQNTPATTQEEVIALYYKSTAIDPSISNPAWRRLFDFIKENQPQSEDRDEALIKIIDEHIKQNAHSHITLNLIFKYCKLKGDSIFKGKSLFTYLEDGFNLHFPRTEAEQFDLYATACLEFVEHERLLSLLERTAQMPDLAEDEDFIASMMGLAYDFYRDIDAGIIIGENFLIKNESLTVQEVLLSSYIQKGEHGKAAQLLPKLRGLIDEENFIRKEADILEARGRYQDAIDKMRTMPEKLGFQETYCVHISYLYLIMKEYEKAQAECKELLDKHAFDLSFEAEIINYEYARFKRKNKVDPKRITPLSTSAKDVSAKAVALLLLGEEEKSFSILKKECEKEFSNVDSFLRWPVLENIKPRLTDLKSDLIKNRRSIESNAVFSKFNIINV